jgi:hypothetical protein
VKWTTKQPKVSGYYWLKQPQHLMDGTPVPGYFMPCVVRVKISDDPEWPEATYSSCNYELDSDFHPAALWAGPIPPPRD